MNRDDIVERVKRAVAEVRVREAVEREKARLRMTRTQRFWFRLEQGVPLPFGRMVSVQRSKLEGEWWIRVYKRRKAE